MVITDTASFTGYTYDEVLEVYFAQFRFYDPTDRRFLSEDPIRSGRNWYTYVGSDPLNYIDPLGLDSYVLYDPNDNKDNGFVTKEKEEVMKKELEDKYGTPAHLIAIDSSDYFVEKFNHIGRNGNPIDAVVLYFHMNNDVIGFKTADEWETFDSYFWLFDMDKINNTRAMDAFILLGCKSANTAKDDNLANSFTKKLNANLVVASDGDTYTQKQTERYGFLWLKSKSHVNIWTDDLNPEGFKVYWKSVGTPKTIGSSFNGIGALIDAAKALR